MVFHLVYRCIRDVAVLLYFQLLVCLFFSVRRSVLSCIIFFAMSLSGFLECVTRVLFCFAKSDAFPRACRILMRCSHLSCFCSFEVCLFILFCSTPRFFLLRSSSATSSTVPHFASLVTAPHWHFVFKPFFHRRSCSGLFFLPSFLLFRPFSIPLGETFWAEA